MTWLIEVASGRQQGGVANLPFGVTTIGSTLDQDVVLADLATSGRLVLEVTRHHIKVVNETDNYVLFDEQTLLANEVAERKRQRNAIGVEVGGVGLLIRRKVPVLKYNESASVETPANESAAGQHVGASNTDSKSGGSLTKTYLSAIALVVFGIVGSVGWSVYASQPVDGSKADVPESPQNILFRAQSLIDKKQGVHWSLTKDGQLIAILDRASTKTSQAITELKTNKKIPVAAVYIHDMEQVNRVISLEFAEPKLQLQRGRNGFLLLSGSYSAETRLQSVKSYLNDALGSGLYEVDSRLELVVSKRSAPESNWLRGATLVRRGENQMPYLRTSDGGVVFEGATIEGKGQLVEIRQDSIIIGAPNGNETEIHIH